MGATTVANVDMQSESTVKSSVYQSKRTTYMIESIFTDKVKLADALFRIALTKIKSA